MIRVSEVRPEHVVRYADKSTHTVRRVHHVTGSPDVLIIHATGPDRLLFGEALVEVLP